MTSNRSRLLAVAVICCLVIGFLIFNGSGRAQDDEQKARDTILKMADTLAKNDIDEARKQSKQLKDADLDDIMPLFALRTARNKKALGLGDTPGAIKPDGIEKKLETLGKSQLSAGEVANEAPAIERAAYVAAAIAMVIHDKCPVDSKQGNKDPADWKKWSDDMEKQAMALAAAAKAKNAATIQKVAGHLDEVCKSCHVPFK
jgi:cytochrome c556